MSNGVIDTFRSLVNHRIEEYEMRLIRGGYEDFPEYKGDVVYVRALKDSLDLLKQAFKDFEKSNIEDPDD